MHVLSKDVWASQLVNENEKINFSPSGTIPTALLIFKAQKFTGIFIILAKKGEKELKFFKLLVYPYCFFCPVPASNMVQGKAY